MLRSYVWKYIYHKIQLLVPEKAMKLFESDIQQVKLDGKKETKGGKQYAKGITLKDVTQKASRFKASRKKASLNLPCWMSDSTNFIAVSGNWILS